MASHSSTLAWKIPWTEEPGRLQSMRLLSEVSYFTFTFYFHALEKEMSIHSSILAWRIPGTEESSGLPSMGSHRVRHDWSDLAAVVFYFIFSIVFYHKVLSIVLFAIQYVCSVAHSCPTLCDPMDCSPPGSSLHVDSPGKNTGVGSHALLWGIFPNQGLNSDLPHCRWILYHLNQQLHTRTLIVHTFHSWNAHDWFSLSYFISGFPESYFSFPPSLKKAGRTRSRVSQNALSTAFVSPQVNNTWGKIR